MCKTHTVDILGHKKKESMRLVLGIVRISRGVRENVGFVFASLTELFTGTTIRGIGLDC